MTMLNKKLFLNIYFYIQWLIILLSIKAGFIIISAMYIFLVIFFAASGNYDNSLLFNLGWIGINFLGFLIGLACIVFPILSAIFTRKLLKGEVITKLQIIIMIIVPVVILPLISYVLYKTF